MIVAYSGGVDSGLLLYLAHKICPGSRGVVARSPSLSEREFQLASLFAKKHNIPLEVVSTNEMDNINYVKNDSERCYHCKSELFNVLKKISETGDDAVIVYGANYDDPGDYRPGMKVAEEYNIRAPFLEMKWTKKNIRELARYFKLEISDKPSSPCLASRIPYGTPVTRKILIKIERAEDILKDFGFSNIRVRHYDRSARIEIPEYDFNRIIPKGIRMKIITAFKKIGYDYVTLDMEGLRSGNLNKVLVI